MLTGVVWCRKQRYLKKEGKAAAPPGSETDALGRVIIHDPFAPS